MSRETSLNKLFKTETLPEISDYLLWGFLSLWIFSIWRMRRILYDHIKSREKAFISYFKEISLENQSQHSTSNKFSWFYISSKAYFFAGYAILSLFLGIVTIFFLYLNIVNLETLDRVWRWAMGSGGIAFAIAIILCFYHQFIAIKSHETQELNWTQKVIGNFAENANIQHNQQNINWKNIKNLYYLFGIIAVPVSMAPWYATLKITIQYKETSGQLLVMGFAIGGVLLLFGILHIIGTYLFLKPYKDHLSLEMTWKKTLIKPNFKEYEYQSKNNQSGTSTELAAVMFTDIVGFSKKMEKDEEKTLNLLDKSNRIIRQIFKKHHGIEIKTIGDAFMVMFRSAADAVKSAIEMQQELKEHRTFGKEIEAFSIRIGIHLGDVILKEGDVFGDGVNIASRVEALADPGGICITEHVFNVIKKKMNIRVEALKDITLKNIEESPVVYKIIFD